MQDNSLKTMNWIALQTEAQLNDIKEKSTRRPQLIFKHSTRCSTSALVKGRLERAQKPEAIDFYYLDLLNHRPISNKIADTFSVDHESPQVLLIRDGACVYDESHLGITMDNIIDASTS
jgi:bacillithiol system protein YtxJ